MKNYLLKLGKNAKKAFVEKVNSNNKNQVLKDYCSLLLKNKLKILGYITKSEVVHKDDMVEI